MTIRVQCACGRRLRARDEFGGTRAECPSCGRTVQIPELATQARQAASANIGISAVDPAPMEITDFLDPPKSPVSRAKPDKPPVMRRMFEAMLDPRSIQWMLMLGGGLLVLGLIILLINWLDIKAPFVIAGLMGAGTLAVLGGGWYLTLKTKYKTAGRAMTFLACVVAPLNLWYYHAQDAIPITVQDHLWLGGVVCCLLYAATVRLLRDPLFMYAVEAGVTLTVLLFLPVVNMSPDATTLSIVLMVLGLISIHAERAFLPNEGEFTRQRYGMPLFWIGHAHVGVSLFILLGTQILSWLNEPIIKLFGSGFKGNLLSNEPLLAGGLWLLGTYVYLYSDIVVRRVGVYVYFGAFSLLMAIVTLIGWQFHSPEAVIITLAIVGLGANLAQTYVAQSNITLTRVAAPPGIILSAIPLLIGWILHIRVMSAVWGLSVPIEWLYVVAMLVVAVSNRVSAYLYRHSSIRLAAAYLFFSAAGLLLAAAGLLPLTGLEQWYEQAPLLMLIPIGYIVASRLWRGQSPERPLGWIAHMATGIILFHVLVGALQSLQAIGAATRPTPGNVENLLLGLVFVEAAVFYSLAGLFRRRGVNAYFAAAAACGALWQFMGYLDIPGYFHTMLYAVLGLAALATARFLGLEQIVVYRKSGDKGLATRGRGLTAFQSGNAILSIALLSAFWQGVAQLVAGGTTGIEKLVLLLTTAISVVAIWIVPSAAWRRTYVTASVALGSVAFLAISIGWLRDLTLGEKVELVCVVAGAALLVASYIGRFRETDGAQNETVGMGLFLGSVLATVPLLIAVAYHRWWGDGISVRDELAILIVTVGMLVTGLGWQTRSPTVFGGGCLTLYLILLIVELARRAEEMVGIAVFMAIIGAIVFAVGIVLSVYREKLLELPDTISKREGVFRVLNWR